MTVAKVNSVNPEIEAYQLTNQEVENVAAALNDLNFQFFVVQFRGCASQCQFDRINSIELISLQTHATNNNLLLCITNSFPFPQYIQACVQRTSRILYGIYFHFFVEIGGQS